MGIKIFYGFLTLVTVAILWMLPVSAAIHDYRTDPRTDSFNVPSGQTTVTLVLHTPVYDADTSSISISSNNTADAPVLVAYTEATHSVQVGGLDAESSRTLDVTYLVDALAANPAVSVFMNILPVIWILILVAFPVVALAVIVRR